MNQQQKAATNPTKFRKQTLKQTTFTKPHKQPKSKHPTSITNNQNSQYTWFTNYYKIKLIDKKF